MITMNSYHSVTTNGEKYTRSLARIFNQKKSCEYKKMSRTILLALLLSLPYQYHTYLPWSREHSRKRNPRRGCCILCLDLRSLCCNSLGILARRYLCHILLGLKVRRPQNALSLLSLQSKIWIIFHTLKYIFWNMFSFNTSNQSLVLLCRP